MKDTLNRISAIVSRYLAVIILVVTAVSLFIPKSFLWMQATWITPMLCVVMFGMGLTLKWSDFRVVLTRPKDIIVGFLTQFTVMPFLAWLLCKAFQLPTEIAIGVILVGCCPGGTASNVITYLAGGDLALSVGMTAMSTLFAPILTPLLTWLLAKNSVDVNVMEMVKSILEVVVLPIALGFLINHFWEKKVQQVIGILPSVSTLAIALIIACIVSHTADKILSCSLLIIIVVALHNLLGMAFGYGVGSLLSLSRPKRTALCIEVGMQNSGLATAMANAHFAQYPLAAVPGAIFSVWHNFSGSMMAALFRRLQRKYAGEDKISNVG